MEVWFVTGAGSGIGTGIAKTALQAGDRVVATGRNLDKVRNALRDVVSENLAFIQLDVADEAQAKTAVDEAVKQFDRSDVLVNNAGYSLLGNFEEMTTADIESQCLPTSTAWCTSCKPCCRSCVSSDRASSVRNC